MTGGEIVPAAKAAKKALAGDASTKKLLADLAKDHPAAKDAAASYATRIAIKQGLLLKLYKPLAKLAGVSRDYFENDFAGDMAEKIGDIPDEHLISPKPSVAVPAMQALGYSLDEPSLKEMYLKLLATATDGRAADDAHPSFAEIIRQLTAEEASHLPLVLTGVNIAIVNVVRYTDESKSGYQTLARNILDLTRGGNRNENPKIAVWVDNWARLGLIDVDFQSHLVGENAYDWVNDRPELIRLKVAAGDGGDLVEPTKGLLVGTSFGQQFAKAVLP